MATACFSETPRTTLPGRQEILDWYEKVPRQGASQILGVAAHAGPEALRAAFVSLARRFHPDVLAGEDADLRQKGQAIFARVTEAYRSLAANPLTQKRAETSARASTPPTPQPPTPQRAAVASPPATPRPPTPQRAAVASPPATRPGEQHSRVEEAVAEAEASIAAGDAEGAVTRLQQVLTLADRRQRRRIRLTLAQAYVADSRRYRTGVSLLNDILRDEPGDAEALTLLGALFRREGLLARAEILLARGVVADPQNARARAELREVRMELQRRRAPAAKPGPGRGLLRLLTAR